MTITYVQGMTKLDISYLAIADKMIYSSKDYFIAVETIWRVVGEKLDILMVVK